VGIVMGFLVFCIVGIISSFLLEKMLNKLLGVKKKKISETSGKKIDLWGRRIFLCVFLCSIPFFVWADVLKWYSIFYLTILLGFESFLEWKYLKNSKQYITTVIILIYGLIFIYNVEYFRQLF
jgi:hypothetical protein